MRCPTCANDIGNHSVCPRCGTLPGVEAHIRNAKLRFTSLIDRLSAQFPRRFEMHHFLWACAVTPLFIVPPLVSLAYSIAAMRGGPTQKFSTNFEWIAIISVLNLIISALLLYKLNLLVNELWIQGQDNLGSFIGRLLEHLFGSPSSTKSLQI